MIRAALGAATRRLARTSSSPRLDAELLLADLLGTTRAMLLGRDTDPLPDGTRASFESRITRRANGEPVAYLLGRREFWTLTLAVGPGVLVPRPETELLVEAALEALAGRTAPRVLDLGTGSGAIGLAIASARPDAHVDLVDASPDALAIAEANRRALGLDNARTLPGDWFAALAPARYDAILANPPYLADSDPHLASPELAHEPPVALVSGPTGLEALAAIAGGALAHLGPGGLLALEHGASQGEAVRGLLDGAGFGAVWTRRDLAGLERATQGTRRD
jgi:release factor glutamine methyltransferase